MKNFPIIAVDERVELKEQTNARVPEKKLLYPIYHRIITIDS